MNQGSLVQPITDETFEQEVLTSELPVLVELHADWCQPCKKLAPIVEQVAQELRGKLTVVKVDIDKNPALRSAFRAQSIPMLVLISKGRAVDQILGLTDKASIMKLVQPHLPRDGAEVLPKELAQLIQQRRAIPVDTRDAGSFTRYRIPGAINIPADQVLARARELSGQDGRVRVLYARTGEEPKALAEQLLSLGVTVGFLAGGFLHWEADNLPVERGGTN